MDHRPDSRAWLAENAGALGADGSRVYVAGHSAGGHLTAMVLATDWEEWHGLDGDVLAQPETNHFAAIDGFADADNPLCAAILERMGVAPR